MVCAVTRNYGARAAWVRAPMERASDLLCGRGKVHAHHVEREPTYHAEDGIRRRAGRGLGGNLRLLFHGVLSALCFLLPASADRRQDGRVAQIASARLPDRSLVPIASATKWPNLVEHHDSLSVDRPPSTHGTESRSVTKVLRKPDRTPKRSTKCCGRVSCRPGYRFLLNLELTRPKEDDTRWWYRRSRTDDGRRCLRCALAGDAAARQRRKRSRACGNGVQRIILASTVSKIACGCSGHDASSRA